MFYRDLQNSYVVNSTTPQLVNQQPAHQASRTPQQQQQQATTTTEERSSVTNGRANSGSHVRKLIPLPEAPPNSSSIAYKLQKVLIESKMIPCINMKPNAWADMLVSLPDLVSNFFNNVPVQSCQQVMQILGLEVYKANS